MTLKTSTIAALMVVLLAFVFASCAISETAWIIKENSPDPLRQLTGLSSIAVGNLSPAARNPGLELFCTSIYDTPGGYCSYYTAGVPFNDFQFLANITLTGDDK